MYVVLIGFHSNHAVTFGITDGVYLLLYIVNNRTFKQLLAVLGNKNDMYFQAIFIYKRFTFTNK